MPKAYDVCRMGVDDEILNFETFINCIKFSLKNLKPLFELFNKIKYYIYLRFKCIITD